MLLVTVVSAFKECVAVSVVELASDVSGSATNMGLPRLVCTYAHTYMMGDNMECLSHTLGLGLNSF